VIKDKFIEIGRFRHIANKDAVFLLNYLSYEIDFVLHVIDFNKPKYTNHHAT